MKAVTAGYRVWGAIFMFALMSAGLLQPGLRGAGAQMRPPAPLSPPLVIRADPGGLLGAREREMQRLRQSGKRVELRGTCNSACTMYLGLENICIDPRASFGFHGPSSYGRPLPAAEFERWSQIMARNYREPLRTWFLNTARHRLTGHIRLSGDELIRLGYPEC